MSARPIPEGPRWPWLKVVEDVAESMGNRVTIAVFAPYSGLCGEFLRLRFAEGPYIIVQTDTEVLFQGTRPGEMTSSDFYRKLEPRTYVSTADEFAPVLRALLVDLPRPDAAYLARLERQRVEIV